MKLARFTVCGFRNFKKPVTIDFTAVHDYHFNTECVDEGLLAKLGIYGPNGSGKTNLGIALFDIVLLLSDKFVANEIRSAGNFLNLDKKTDSASFVYEFRKGMDTYVFSYNKDADEALIKESLSVNGTVIYDYDFSEKKFAVLKTGNAINRKLNFEYFDGRLSVLRYIANNSVQKEDSPIRLIMDFVNHMLWFRSVRQNSFVGLDTWVTNLDDWIIKNGLIKDFNQFLKNVCNIDIELASATSAENTQVLVENHKNGKVLFSRVASSGTVAAELFYFWMKRFNEVSLLFMDEFDAYYHFELARKIIEILKNYPQMQVIFTTHNTALMGNNILRPDCYLIISNGELKPYPECAGGKEIREGHNLEKIYRNGGLNV
ncbi:MAG TPA: AAA family ATPase [Methanocorpusculum sp.]|nr:AAA family ATPase [Methanocorpusculum sp.]